MHTCFRGSPRITPAHPEHPGVERQMLCTSLYEKPHFFDRTYPHRICRNVSSVWRRMRICNLWKMLKMRNLPACAVGGQCLSSQKSCRDAGALPFVTSVTRQGTLHQELPWHRDGPEKRFVLQESLGN